MVVQETLNQAAIQPAGSLLIEVLQAAADKVGVCQRPIVRQVTDRATGQIATAAIPCGSTRASICRGCAERARRLRMQQCQEGWHLVEEPLPTDDDETAELPDAASDREGTDEQRRTRSTRRLTGFPDLPAVALEHCSVGRTFTDPRTGAQFRPSMFVTLTLPSYGRIVPGAGVPANPERYDYRRAALDALYFPRLVDRWWQNLRRCAGFKVQYFASVEPQRRLAPHLHAAIRGAIPRATLRAVTRATYCALWWPPTHEVRYDALRGDQLPVWDRESGGYVDPATGELLPSWEEALAQVDADDSAEPLHVVSFGRQLDIKGIIAGSEDSQRSVGYLCKYLTKAIAETYVDPDRPDPAYEAHIDRLHAEVLWLPCSETCANWLRYGVTPKDPGAGLIPGMCSSKAHDRECLGLGGRRVLVSRHWTGKTLSDHRADRAAVVRAVLEEAGIEAPDADRWAADVLHIDGGPRFIWEDLPRDERAYARTIAASIRQRLAWREQYERAKELARAGPAA